MDQLLEGAIDIYAEFGIGPDASDADVSRQYRKLALRFHPDKDPSAAAQAKFHLHQAIYTVLTQPALRRQYDDIVAHRSASGSAAASQIAAFREKLRQQEALAAGASVAVVSPVFSAGLASKGVQLRRQLQQQMQAGGGYVGTRDLSVPQYMADFLHRRVHVYWKQRPEAEAHINPDVLGEIMAVFGVVSTADICVAQTSAQSIRPDYCVGTVHFQRAVDAEQATRHDYSRSSGLWRSTRVRKQASLLRRVEFARESVDTLLQPDDTVGLESR